MYRLRDNHANAASRQKISAKPTRVAMDDWQLQALKKADAAVEVQKKASPVMQEVKRPDTRPPERSGIERRAPMLGDERGRTDGSCGADGSVSGDNAWLREWSPPFRATRKAPAPDQLGLQQESPREESERDKRCDALKRGGL